MATRYYAEHPYDRPVVVEPAPSFSIPSLLAIACAIASFPVGALLGVVLAVCAIIFGLIGAVRAMSPRVRGGFVSMFSIVAGLVGIVAAVIKLLVFYF